MSGPSGPSSSAEFSLSTSLAGTSRLGSTLGPLAPAGLIVALNGPLGAGKTTFVRGVAEGLGVADSRIVASPTFVLIHEYPAQRPIVHFDVYRLRRAEDFLDLGVEEYFSSEAVCLIEWADRVREYLPPDHVAVDFGLIDEQTRAIHVRAHGARFALLVGCWLDAFRQPV